MDRFTVNPEPAQIGHAVTICYDNTDRPNEQIDVTLFNALGPGDQGYESMPLTIATDDNGYGCVFVYELPDWVSHVVGTSDSDDHPILTS